MKAVGLNAAKPPIEVLHDRALEPGRAQRPDLVAQIGDARRRPLGHEELARVRLERHDSRDESALCGRGDDARDQCLVAAMHAIEIADRQRTGMAR
jgi:hypothetical protein